MHTRSHKPRTAPVSACSSAAKQPLRRSRHSPSKRARAIRVLFFFFFFLIQSLFWCSGFGVGGWVRALGFDFGWGLCAVRDIRQRDAHTHPRNVYAPQVTPLVKGVDLDVGLLRRGERPQRRLALPAQLFLLFFLFVYVGVVRLLCTYDLDIRWPMKTILTYHVAMMTNQTPPSIP